MWRSQRDLVTRARAGQLSREEYQGGTFTVSNMGMLDVDQFNAIINPGEAGIIAIGLTGFWIQLIYGLIIMVSVSIYAILLKKKS